MQSLKPQKTPRGKAIDLSHHLNTLSRSRVPSPLKYILQYMFEPGMISFAGGLPHPSLFPFQNIQADLFSPDSSLVPGAPVTSTIPVSIPKYATENQKNSLAVALQYGNAKGSPAIESFLRDFTERVMKPGYEDYEILLNSGSTEGWSKVANLLLETGDYILVEGHTYPSAQALWAPMGCKGVPIALDPEGIIVEDLERILVNWDADYPGEKQPRVLYTVPVGQNPTACTLPLERKKAIYDLCVKYDIIICEDDPYYWLQLPRYTPPQARKGTNGVSRKVSGEEVVSALIPTFLSIDYQGRVIRLETFSKTLAPGLRLGYFICNPIFAERLLRATEVVSQTPSGASQAIVQELFTTWGYEGMITWLSNLRESYAVRRDWMCDILADTFDVVPSSDSLTATAYVKDGGVKAPLFTFAYPKAGMFLWMKLDLTQNSAFKEIQKKGGEDPEAQWAEAFWRQMIDLKILLTPGSYYTPFQGHGVPPRREAGVTYFRMAYSYETREEMVVGMARMAKAFKASWKQ